MRGMTQEEYDSPEEKQWRAEYLKIKGHNQTNPDPVSRMVAHGTAREYVDWMRFRGDISRAEAEPNADGWNCLECNLREAFKWHRLQGRLDRHPILAIIAQLMGLRQSVKVLERP